MHVFFAPPSVLLAAPVSSAIARARLARRGAACARRDARRAERRARAWTLALLLALGAGGGAFAQDAGETPPSETTDTGGSGTSDPDAEVIKIRGQRTDVSQQDQAIAISAFGQEQLDQLGVSDVAALQQNVPSLHIGQSGTQAVITLRGVGISNLSLTGTQGVILHQDGVALGRPTAALGAFYDVEYVGVARGPQGTQGGLNTSGGWIEVRSRKPTEDFQAETDYQIGTYDEHIWRGFVNSPVWDDKAMLRVTGRYERHDGYQKPLGLKTVGHFGSTTYDEEDRWDNADNLLMRTQLRGVNGNFEWHWIGQHAYRRGNGPAQHLLSEPGVLTQTGKNVGLDGARAGFDNRFARTAQDVRTTYRDFLGDQDIQQWFTSMRFQYDIDESPLGPVRLESLIAFNRSITDVSLDSDLTDADAVIVISDSVADQYSAEIKMRSLDQSPFNWLIGAIWWQESAFTDAFVDLSGGNPSSDGGIENELETDHISGFAELDYQLTEAFTIGAGLRWSEDTKDVGAQRFGLNINFDPNAGPSDIQAFPVIRLEETFQALTYKTYVKWDVTDSSSLTFNVTTGSKPGGFPLGQSCSLGGAGSSGSTDACASYRAEEVRQLELTAKNEFFDQRLRLNLTLFWTDYDPYQVCFVQGIEFKCEDNGDAIVRGLELEWTIFPVPELMISGNFNLLDARLDNFRLTDPAEERFIPGTTVQNPKFGIQQDLSGNPLPRSPKYNINMIVRYEIDTASIGLPSWGKIAPQLQYLYQSRTTFREWDTPAFEQGRTSVFNIRLFWYSQDTRWQVEAFVNNVTDLDKQTFINFGAQGSVQAQFAPPRTAGIRFQFTY